MREKINIVQDPEKPVERNILALAIKDIATAMKRLVQTGVTREAVVVLVKDRTGLSKRDIEIVLNGIAQLERDFVR